MSIIFDNDYFKIVFSIYILQLEWQRLAMQYDSAVLAAVNNTVAASKLYDKLMTLNDIDRESGQHVTGSFVVISNPKKSVVDGTGELFQQFIETKHICGYAGEKDKIAFPKDSNYDVANFRVITFEKSLGHLRTDLRQCNFFINI